MNPLLQIWQKAGLNNILFMDEDGAQRMRVEASSHSTSPSLAKPDTRNELKKTTPEYKNVPTKSYQSQDHAPYTGTNTAPTPAKTPSAKTFMEREIIPFSTWPNSWITLKERCKLPTDSIKPRVAWTYEALEQDLMGEINPARQDVMRKLLRDLKHPVGRHFFWPYRLPNVLEQTDHMEKMFWSGLALMRPRVLLVFGSEARDNLALPKKFIPFVLQEISGVLVLQMHKPETLAENEETYNEALTFLKKYLGFCKN